VLFDVYAEYVKKEIDNKIYFYRAGETFFFEPKINKMDTCVINLTKFTIDKSKVLSEKGYQFHKEKKQKEEKKKNLK
jgi:hypothetical protein